MSESILDPHPKSILIVCTGNVARSPTGEAALRRALERLRADHPKVTSAGTAGWEGSPALPDAIRAASELDLDLSSHVARTLTPAILERSDLIVCMASEHRAWIAHRSDRAIAERAFTLKPFVRSLESALGNATAESESDQDVRDPYGSSIGTFRAVATEIAEWCDRLGIALSSKT